MRVLTLSLVVVVVVPLAGGQFVDSAMAQTSSDRRLAVAWDDMGAGTGMARAMSAAPPWAFQTDPLNIGQESVLRFAGGRLYVVSKADDTISVVDPDTWAIERVYSLTEGSDPLDIAVVSPDTAYVSRRLATHLLHLDLVTGTTTDVADLSIFADPDGVPDMSMMALHEDRLFVQIRRIDVSSSSFVPPAYLAVVDVVTGQLIDVDAITPGVQAIELQGTAPKFKMQIVPQTRRLFVSATGDVFDEGGIEMIDLDSLQSVGLAVREADDMTGVDLGAFVMVTLERGYLTFTTDFGLSSHLIGFSLSGGVDAEQLYETVGYFVPVLPYDAQTQTLFFPDGDASGSPGVHVFDAITGTRLTPEPIATSGLITDLAFLCDGDCGSPSVIPAVSDWGLVVMVLLLLSATTIRLSRRGQPSGVCHIPR